MWSELLQSAGGLCLRVFKVEWNYVVNMLFCCLSLRLWFLTLFQLDRHHVCGERVLDSEGTSMLNELLTPMGVNEECLISHYSSCTHK